MNLEDGETLLDGGTTCLTVLKNSKRQYITVDYSSPQQNPRCIFIGKKPFARDKKLEVGSLEEKEVVDWLLDELISQFGVGRVQDFIEGRFDSFIRGKWLFALNFLRILAKDRTDVVNFDF